MNIHFKISLLLLSLFCFLPNSEAQLLRKIKQKAERAVDRAVDKVIEKEVDKALGVEGTETSDNSSYNSGIEGEGKKLTPPDVAMHITRANEAVTQAQYTDAKFAIQQAILGVELEIGYAILEGLPQSINGMNFLEEEDQVSSTGYGFVGFTVGRVYESNNKALQFSIVSNNILVNSYSGMISNAGYASNEGDYKSVMIDGNKAILQYSGGNYELGIPLGQSSLIVLDCDGFADESEVIQVAKQFKVNEIKAALGEQ
ncbi:MAG: hypothetical protein AAF849_18055 [Bacteroidota bacterium]